VFPYKIKNCFGVSCRIKSKCSFIVPLTAIWRLLTTSNHRGIILEVKRWWDYTHFRLKIL